MACIDSMMNYSESGCLKLSPDSKETSLSCFDVQYNGVREGGRRGEGVMQWRDIRSVRRRQGGSSHGIPMNISLLMMMTMMMMNHQRLKSIEMVFHPGRGGGAAGGREGTEERDRSNRWEACQGVEVPTRTICSRTPGEIGRSAGRLAPTMVGV